MDGRLALVHPFVSKAGLLFGISRMPGVSYSKLTHAIREELAVQEGRIPLPFVELPIYFVSGLHLRSKSSSVPTLKFPPLNLPTLDSGSSPCGVTATLE